MTWNIFNEDAIKWAKEYTGEPFHALFTDAPYHLTSIVKRFGKTKETDNTLTSEKVRNRSDSYSRLIATGFMGQQWDGGDIAFQADTWSAFMGVMYPGAFGMAFSASRNWHRMAVAIEDAGFVIHPSAFFLWVQGQGFPKATKVRADGFDGYKYGLQALKPAVEPVIVFQKPYEGRPIDNIVESGAGVLNIDGGRVPLQDGDEYTINEFDDGMKPFGNGAGHAYKSKKIKNDPRLGGNGSWRTDKAAKNVYEGGYEGVDISSSPLGRYPANLILDEGSAQVLDEQTGNLPGGVASANSGAMGYHGGRRGSTPETGYRDNGGASRFFNVVRDQIDESDPFYYCAKVNPKERNSFERGFRLIKNVSDDILNQIQEHLSKWDE